MTAFFFTQFKYLEDSTKAVDTILSRAFGLSGSSLQEKSKSLESEVLNSLRSSSDFFFFFSDSQ
jgi:hypothetical protein